MSDSSYTFFRRDSGYDKRGGGILVYIQNYLKAFCLHKFQIDNIELTCIQMSSYRFVIVYRPPNFDLNQTTLLCDSLTNICDTNDSIIIIGDLNFPDINWHTYSSPNNIFQRIFNSNISY